MSYPPSGCGRLVSGIRPNEPADCAGAERLSLISCSRTASAFAVAVGVQSNHQLVGATSPRFQ